MYADSNWLAVLVSMGLASPALLLCWMTGWAEPLGPDAKESQNIENAFNSKDEEHVLKHTFMVAKSKAKSLIKL